MDTAVLGKLGDGNGNAPAEKFIPWKKRGLSESPVDFGSQQDGTWDQPEVKRQRTEVGEVVGEVEGELEGEVEGEVEGEAMGESPWKGLGGEQQGRRRCRGLCAWGEHHRRGPGLWGHPSQS